MDGQRLWLLLPRPVRELPADLAAVTAAVVATNVAVVAPVVRTSPLRVILGLPFVLFLPGYAFVAALFPEAGESPAGSEATEGPDEGDTEDGGWRSRDGGIDGVERVALSFGLSIAIVPLLGLILNFTPWGIRLIPILVTVSGFTLVSTAVAASRRRDLDPDDRFRVPYEAWIAGGRAELFDPETRADAALNVLLVLSVLLAAGSVGYAVAVPKSGERFTEFYLLTETEDGDLVADDYPQNFTVGESRSLHVGITNNEHRPTNYTMVVEIHDVRIGNNSTTVVRERELTREGVRLAHNETWLQRTELAPRLVGERLRLTFLLYRGQPPAEPSVDNAYRELHLWVNVSERTGRVTRSTPESGPAITVGGRG